MSGRLSALLLLLPFLCGCLAYPHPYWVTLKGTARVEAGKPPVIKATVVKECETVDGVQEYPGWQRVAKVDAQGHYKVSLHTLSWDSKNFVSLKTCKSRVQLSLCRDYCRDVDQIDIDVLGK